MRDRDQVSWPYKGVRTPQVDTKTLDTTEPCSTIGLHKDSILIVQMLGCFTHLTLSLCLIGDTNTVIKKDGNMSTFVLVMDRRIKGANTGAKECSKFENTCTSN